MLNHNFFIKELKWCNEVKKPNIEKSYASCQLSGQTGLFWAELKISIICYPTFLILMVFFHAFMDKTSTYLQIRVFSYCSVCARSLSNIKVRKRSFFAFNLLFWSKLKVKTK